MDALNELIKHYSYTTYHILYKHFTKCLTTRSEKKRRKKKRRTSRSHSGGRHRGGGPSKSSRRNDSKKRSSKTKDGKNIREKEDKGSTISREEQLREQPQIQSGNEFTSEESNKIVISSIEDIPVMLSDEIRNENSTPREPSGDDNKGSAESQPNEKVEEPDDDARALAEIQKEGEAYNARQKKKSNFSFEILSSKTARLRNLIQLNNSNKSNNNNGAGIKTVNCIKLSGGSGLLNQSDKTTPTADSISSPITNTCSSHLPLLSNTPLTKEIGSAVIGNSTPAAAAETKDKQNKPERTSRFGPRIIDTANSQHQTVTNQNLKFPKFLPRSTNSSIGDGLLPLPPPECKLNVPPSTNNGSNNITAAAKLQANIITKDGETDSLGRMRRRRYD